MLSGVIDLVGQCSLDDVEQTLTEQYVQLWLSWADIQSDALNTAIHRIGQAHAAIAQAIALERGDDDTLTTLDGSDAEAAFREAWIWAYMKGLGVDRAYAEESYCLYTVDWARAQTRATLIAAAGARLGAVDATRTRQTFRALRAETA
ncbi:hypothetical protein CKO28_00200 [Rhodovibrio sodomensis]|uniref:Uncharacterized protein n=1 Tax=Rhodovibrio sodomensis TaxID=1088 RepID=A0ABS1D7Y5_9PROT|nr:hypothetical protein [Rhodovibrio sodomensis]MBK1666460.1 hypothetical protein [Rhodovibrio sodomensis]